MNKTIKGTVVKKYGANAIMLNLDGYGNNKMFSQYGGIDVPLEEGHLVEFEYTEKEKDGKIYNNIVAGTMKVVGMKPKDISSNYSQGSSAKTVNSESGSTPSSPDRDTLIVRQTAVKSACDIMIWSKELTPKENLDNILWLSAEFEKWVNR